MPTRNLRCEHDRILRQASLLAGLGKTRMTPDVAREARAAIMGLDRSLVEHLETEDGWMYPLLMASSDDAVRRVAEDCFQNMGSIRGAWIAYRDLWTSDAIVASSERFGLATDGMIGALALRVGRENSEVYPLVDQIAAIPPNPGGPRQAEP